MMEFASGAFGHFTCSFQTVRSQHLAVAGTKGSLSLDWPFAPREPESRLLVNGALEVFGPSDPYRDMVVHFGEAVRGSVPLRHPLARSLAQARALDALFASARDGGRTVAPG